MLKTVWGSNFAQGAKVYVNNVPAVSQWQIGTQFIVFQPPTGFLSGVASVSVVNPGGASVSWSGALTYTAAGPAPTPTTPTGTQPLPSNPSPLTGVQPDPAKLTFSDDFENSSGGCTLSDQWRPSGNDTTVSQSQFVRAGQCAAHMSVGPSDRVTFRTEIDGPGQFYYGREYCMSFSTMYRDWSGTPPSWTTMFQTHSIPGVNPATGQVDWANCSSGRNSITLATTNGNQVGLYVIKNQRVVSGASAMAQNVWGTPLQFNQWMDWTIRYKPSPNNDGIIEVWKDGQKIYQQFGPTVDMQDTCARPLTPQNYLKIGVYKENTPNTVNLYYDNFRLSEGANACTSISE